MIHLHRNPLFQAKRTGDLIPCRRRNKDRGTQVGMPPTGRLSACGCNCTFGSNNFLRIDFQAFIEMFMSFAWLTDKTCWSMNVLFVLQNVKKSGSSVFYLRRKIYCNGAPLCMMCTMIPFCQYQWIMKLLYFCSWFLITLLQIIFDSVKTSHTSSISICESNVFYGIISLKIHRPQWFVHR